MTTLFLTKVPKTYDEEKTAFSTNVAGKNGYLPAKKLKLNSCLSPCTSINSKWIKDLNIRLKPLEVIGIGKDFLNRTPAVQQLRERMNKWECIKLKASVQQTKWSLN
jgi:hypothetical protein